ncbi:MAG TPA: TonB family protein [Candidatus Acidoferrum sp.]|nr:TonB family protein [Candidatus Acidoferrum sp.]
MKRNRVSAVLRTGATIAWTGTLCLVLVNVHGAYAQTPAKSHRKAIVKVQPQYPAVLKNGHFEGQVRIYATVLADGSVAKVEVKGGNPMLSQYAAEAVMKWKYAPGPYQSLEEVVFNFDAYR